MSIGEGLPMIRWQRRRAVAEQSLLISNIRDGVWLLVINEAKYELIEGGGLQNFDFKFDNGLRGESFRFGSNIAIYFLCTF